MKKIIYQFGLIAGLVVSAMLILSTNIFSGVEDFNYDLGQLIGYASMLVAFSTIFVGVKRHRDHNLGGIITFQKALAIGLAITLIASALYVITWMVISGGVNAEALMDTYFQQAIEQANNSGKSAEAIKAEVDKLNRMRENYGNPFIKIMITLSEIFPVGLVVSIISAFILRKK